MHAISRFALLLAVSTLVLPGCYFSRRAADVDRTPVVDTGMGAAVILPGETMVGIAREYRRRREALGALADALGDLIHEVQRPIRHRQFGMAAVLKLPGAFAVIAVGRVRHVRL